MGAGVAVEVELPEEATAAQALEALSRALGGAAVSSCALATESEVLRPGDALPERARLALLPPVCGG